MIFVTAHRKAGRSEIAEHGSLRSVREYLDRCPDGTLVIDLVEEARQEESLLALLETLPNNACFVSARVAYHLDEDESAGEWFRANGEAVFIDGRCPLWRLRRRPGSLLPTRGAEPASEAPISARRIVEQLVNRQPIHGGLPPPKRLVNRIQAGFFEGFADLLGRSEQELLEVPGVGAESISQLKGWVRSRTASLGRTMTLAEVREAIRDLTDMGVSGAESVPTLVQRLPASARRIPIRFLEGLSARARGAFEREGIEVLGDLLAYDEGQMVRWKNFAEASLGGVRAALLDLVQEVEGGENLAHSSTAAIVQSLLLRRPLLTQLDERIAVLPGRLRAVVEERWLTITPAKLDELAERWGIARERVRQIQKRALQRLGRLEELGQEADARLASLRRSRASPLLLSQLAALDPWFEGAEAAPDRFARVLVMLGCRHRIRRGQGLAEAIVTLEAVQGMPQLARLFVKEALPSSTGDSLPQQGRAFLERLGVPELLPVLLTSVDGSCAAGSRVLFPRRKNELVAILERQKGPVHVREILRHLRRAGHPADEPTVRASLHRLRVQRTGPSTYVLPSKLSAWLELLPHIRRDVVAFLDEHPERQWNTGDLLAVMKEEQRPWAAGIEDPYVLEFLLRRTGEVVYLGRGIWTSRRSGVRSRVPVAELATEILLAAGGVLSREELTRRLRRVRSLKKPIGNVWPLIRLRDGRIGLAEKVLGIDERTFQALRERTLEALEENHGRLGPEEVAELWRRSCPGANEVGADVLARALATPCRIALDGDGDGLRLNTVPRVPARRAPRR